MGVPYPADGVTWTWTGKLEPDDVIVLEFNLGGYVVSSKPYTIPSGKSGATGGCDADLSKLKKVSGAREEYYVDVTGLKQGPYITWYDDARAKMNSKGCYQNNLKVGESIVYYENGNIWSRGYMKDDRQNGEWSEYWENGNIWFKGYYADSKEIGNWTYYYENGMIMSKGSYKGGGNRIATGEWIEYYENGKISRKGDYEDGKQIGRWTYYDENGKITRQEDCVDDVCTEIK